MKITLTFKPGTNYLDMPQPSKSQYREFNLKLRELVVSMFPGLDKAEIMYITSDLIHQRNQAIREHIRKTGDCSLFILLEDFGVNFEDCPESLVCSESDADVVWERFQPSWDELVGAYTDK